jgi:ribosomal protein L32E
MSKARERLERTGSSRQVRFRVHTAVPWYFSSELRHVLIRSVTFSLGLRPLKHRRQTAYVYRT